MVVGGDARVKDAEVRAEANNLLSNPWYKPDWAARWFMGENTTGNSAGVSSGLSRYASLLVRSGMYPDAKSALAASVEYFSDPKVSARINGTRYLRAELPTPPGPAESQDEWFGKWIDAVPKKLTGEAVKPEPHTIASPLGWIAPGADKWLDANRPEWIQGLVDGGDRMRASSRNREAASQTRVEYAEAARAYVVYINATPLLGKDGNVVTYTREQIQKWYADEHQRMIDGMVKNHAAPATQGAVFKGTPAPMSGAARRGTQGS